MDEPFPKHRPGDDPRDESSPDSQRGRDGFTDDGESRLHGKQQDAATPTQPTGPTTGRPGIDPHLDRPQKRLSRLDLEMDPLLRLEDNRKSVRNAIVFAVMIPLLTLTTGLIIALISRSQGGPICDSGHSNWICTRTYEIIFPVLPGVISFGGLIIACGITWRQWAQDRYWQPWLGIIWLLIPFTLLWATGVGAMAIVGHHTFPQP